MKIIKYFAIIGIVVLMTSCVSTARFPVSSTVPTAEIIARKKQDKNNNYVIKLTARYLADARRLNPKMNNYSVWIIVENGAIQNIGQLTNKNAKKAVLKTITPFCVREIFITAEEKGNLSHPEGIEISRAKFNK